jgi:hypothetical protein
VDHHDEWDQWHHEDQSGLGDGDTADLSGDHDLGGHDLGGHDHDHLAGYDEPEHDLSGHDGPDQDVPGHDLTPAPDLVHEGSDGDIHDGDIHDVGSDIGHDAHDAADDAVVDDGPAPADHLVGADPDLPADPDGTWHDGDFPPALDLDTRPEPTDGYPWADPGALGDPTDAYGLDADHTALTVTGAAAPGDLFAYAGIDPPPPGTDPWGHLLGSDDPATSTLARFWGPGPG